MILLVGCIFLQNPEDVSGVSKSKQPSIEEIENFVCEISPEYNMSSEFILALIEKESGYDIFAENGGCIGLMQINPRWQTDRMQRLCIENLWDWKDNIRCGIDYLYELFETYEDPALVLMVYNMKTDSAIKMYESGKISDYAIDILDASYEREMRIAEEVNKDAAEKAIRNGYIEASYYSY